MNEPSIDRHGLQPEFSRLIRLDAIGSEATVHDIAATPEECAALARRFSLESMAGLGATVRISRHAADYRAEGSLTASVVQTCIATGDPLPINLEVPVDIRFVPESLSEPGAEIEVQDEEDDIVEHDGQQIDIGEAVAQTLYLALDPFPRGPQAETSLKAAGVISEEDVRPFSALQTLKDRLAKP